jgi:hypothetical protein
VFGVREFCHEPGASSPQILKLFNRAYSDPADCLASVAARFAHRIREDRGCYD